jgi:type I restriction enzyme S subunit
MPVLVPEVVRKLLPEDWSVVRLRYLVPYMTRGNAPTYEDDGPLNAVSQQTVRWGHFDRDACRGQAGVARPHVLKGYLRKGDVLLNSTGAGTLGRATIFPGGDGYIADGHVTVMRPAHGLDARFLTYVLETKMYQDYIEQSVVVGATKQTELSRERLQDLAVPCPPLAIQGRIADFLDAECRRIEVLKSYKMDHAQLLNEKLVALATEMVFGVGVPGSRKHSGIPTVGTVPAHWSVQQNKTVAREVVELSRTGEEELLTVSHLTGVTPRSEKEVNMFMAESLVGYKKCQPGDLVINTMWAWMGALARNVQ